MLWSRFLSFDFSLSTYFLTIHTCHWTKMTAIVHTCHWSKMTAIVHACHWSKMTATVHTCHWTKMTAISIYNTFLPIDLASTSYPYMYVYVNCRKLFQTIYTNWIPFTSLTPPHFCACPKPGPRFLSLLCHCHFCTQWFEVGGGCLFYWYWVFTITA